MREIKFRAWHKKLKRFAPENCSIQIQGDDSHFSFDTFTGNFDTEVWRLEDCELMQYTGLKDKDGVEIYEGDILRYVKKSTIETLVAPVEYIEDGFHVREEGDCWHSIGGICSDKNHEGSHVGFVIGNIYENPEMVDRGVE